MARPSRLMESLRTAIKQQFPPEPESDVLTHNDLLSPEEELEQRRSELKSGLTDMQRLFLFGKLSGMNDKDSAIAAGYSLSVAENTKQRIWRPHLRAEYERVKTKCLT